MFVLKREEFADNDYSNVRDFINYWGRYYINTPPRVIDEYGREMNDYIRYENEINTGSDLTEQNVERLLRWKMWRTYTHPKKDIGIPNPKVTTVLGKLSTLNQFRRGDCDESTFMQTAEQLISTDSTMRIFLFHICRPWEYPIADQHVFRVFYLLERQQKEDTVTWETYRNGYIIFFQRIAKEYCERPKLEQDMTEYIKDLKMIDNALMSFGQFLLKYNQT
jgi:hypothetical protein